jgi:hypothetical protein
LRTIVVRLLEGDFGEGFCARVLGEAVGILERRLFALETGAEVSERVHALAVVQLQRIGGLRRRRHSVRRCIDKVIVVLQSTRERASAVKPGETRDTRQSRFHEQRLDT